MRIRTLFAFTTGVVTGAAAVYLLDPEHGQVRRREVGAWAATQARDQAREVGARVIDVTRDAAVAAADGFRETRQSAVPATPS